MIGQEGPGYSCPTHPNSIFCEWCKDDGFLGKWTGKDGTDNKTICDQCVEWNEFKRSCAACEGFHFAGPNNPMDGIHNRTKKPICNNCRNYQEENGHRPDSDEWAHISHVSCGRGCWTTVWKNRIYQCECGFSELCEDCYNCGLVCLSCEEDIDVDNEDARDAHQNKTLRTRGLPEDSDSEDECSDRKE